MREHFRDQYPVRDNPHRDGRKNRHESPHQTEPMLDMIPIVHPDPEFILPNRLRIGWGYFLQALDFIRPKTAREKAALAVGAVTMAFAFVLGISLAAANDHEYGARNARTLSEIIRQADLERVDLVLAMGCGAGALTSISVGAFAISAIGEREEREQLVQSHVRAELAGASPDPPAPNIFIMRDPRLRQSQTIA